MRLQKCCASRRARRSGDTPVRASARRHDCALTSGEMEKRRAMVRRTSASCPAGRAWRSAPSAKALASSICPAACSRMAMRATSGPRSGWCAGVRSRARWARSAACPGSVPARESEAFIRVVMATWSPGTALAASWVATSTGSAPASRSAEATWRSRAWTADDGRLARTASRFRSWLKLSDCGPSASSSLLMSSRTGSTRHITSSYPPTFLTVGDADPFRFRPRSWPRC